MRISPYALARRSARSCARYKSFCFKQTRIARYPRNGLSSFSRFKYGISLSPPTSNVRIITGFPCMVSATCLYAWNCSSSEGVLVRSINKNSVRNNPTPSPSRSNTMSLSCGFPMLQTNSTCFPSAVIVGFPTNARSASFSFKYCSRFA